MTENSDASSKNLKSQRDKNTLQRRRNVVEKKSLKSFEKVGRDRRRAPGNLFTRLELNNFFMKINS